MQSYGFKANINSIHLFILASKIHTHTILVECRCVTGFLA